MERFRRAGRLCLAAVVACSWGAADEVGEAFIGTWHGVAQGPGPAVPMQVEVLRTEEGLTAEVTLLVSGGKAVACQASQVALEAGRLRVTAPMHPAGPGELTIVLSQPADMLIGRVTPPSGGKAIDLIVRKHAPKLAEAFAKAKRAEQPKEPASAPEPRERRQCFALLAQVGGALKAAARDATEKQYPALSAQAGELLFDRGVLPAGLRERAGWPPRCPGAADTGPAGALWYLGYCLPDAAAGAAFAQAYRAAAEVGGNPGAGLTPAGGPALERLRDGMGSVRSGDRVVRASEIPVVVECPGVHEGGAHVLFLDGHVAFLPYPGAFPLTKEFVGALKELDALDAGAARKEE